MNTEAKKVIDIALAEVGTKEKPVNITKYAEYFDSLRKQGIYVYNYDKQGAAWCDIFVDYCFAQVFGAKEGVKKLYQPMKGCGAGCKFSANYFRAKGAFYSYPQPGDQVFFGGTGKENHTGIVTRVTKDRFYTVEGNSSNMVKEHSYSLSSKKVSGFGRPDWSGEEAPTTPNKYEYPVIPARGYFKSGDKGVEVQKMQKIILAICPGTLPRYGVDGEVGSETMNAVYQVQAKLGITRDHLYGPKTNAACKRYLEGV